jgi:uncharacterized protein (UPF0179 family)
MKYVLLVALALVAGCSTVKTATTPIGPTVAVDLQKAAYETKLAYKATLQGAVLYIERPRCGRPTSPITCSNQAVVDQMRKYIVEVDVAVQAAENAARSTGPDTTVAAGLVKAAAEAQTAFKNITDANK